jgi:hypothetical protein
MNSKGPWLETVGFVYLGGPRDEEFSFGYLSSMGCVESNERIPACAGLGKKKDVERRLWTAVREVSPGPYE